MDSISTPCLSEASRRFSFIARASGHCTATLMPTMIGIIMVGIQPSGPPTAKITPANISTKGRSVTADKVAEVAKSRTDSNSRSWFANEPEDCGRCSMRIDKALRNNMLPITRSAFLPAASIRWARV